MNNLSWLIYLSDVLPQLGVMFGIAAALSGIAAFISAIIFVASEGELKTIPLAIKFGSVGAALGVMSVIIPPKQTILMIAASEVGETVVKTPEAQEILGDLKAILKKQLEELKK